MKKNSIMFLFIVTALALIFSSCNGKKRNTFLPGQLWLDNNGVPINAHGGGIIYADGIYYWYGEHKLPNRSEEEKAGGGVHCYSSKDLYNWKDEGLVLSVDYDDPDSDIAFGCILERPKVIYNDSTSKYMMYYKLYPKGKGYEFGYLGVAMADSPTGPFVYSHKFLGADSDKGSGDFALYKDKDGSVYHYTVRKPDKAFCVGKFNKEYTYPEGEYKVLGEIPNATEAPALFSAGKYHFMLGSGSSSWEPNTARSFSGISFLGPYKDKGNPTKGTNPHNGLNEEKTFGGQSSFVIKVEGKENAYIAMFDIWKPERPIEGLYVWLPVEINGDSFKITWMDEWNLSVFDK